MLIESMGISAQSLYTAFGSKDALYREAIDRHRETIGGFADRALSGEANAIDAIDALFRESAVLFSSTTDAPGCMITTAPSGVIEDSLTMFGRQLRAEGVQKVIDRLERGIREGHVRPGTDCAAWGQYLSSVLQGMSVQARDGASTSALLSIAAITAECVAGLRP